MIPAHSLHSVLTDLNETLGIKTVKQEVVVPSGKIGLMVAGQPIVESFETRTVTVTIEQWSKLIGVLFCRPESSLGEEEVTNNLNYFHYRSDRFVDFYCVGYSAGESSDSGHANHPVACIEGVDWGFSPKRYNFFRAQLENVSRWKYSGETDLVLVVARKQHGTAAALDFSTAIACNLERMKKDGAFTSVRAFFEQIFRFGETYQGSDPVWVLSDRMGLEKGKNFLQEAVLSLLPETVRKFYHSAKDYAVQDIST